MQLRQRQTELSQLLEGLAWLGEQGRPAARLVSQELKRNGFPNAFQFEEATSWLCNIMDGVEP